MTQYDLPTQNEVANLPRWAQVAFLASWAKAVRHLYRDNDRQPLLSRLIVAAEKSAATGEPAHEYSQEELNSVQWTNLNACAWDTRASHGHSPQQQEDHYADFGAASIAVRAASLAIGTVRAYELSWIDYTNARLDEDARRVLIARFRVLCESSTAEDWNDQTLVPRSFFSLHSEFDLEANLNGSTIIEIVPAITEELIARIREHPRQMLELNPREFEQLIARIVEGFGFAVDLTAPVADGGRDIIAIDYNDRRKYLIECKRYTTKPVGIAIVQRLHGVVHAEAATKGILATTSSFTQPAEKFLSSEMIKWKLEGRNFNGLVEWLDEYEDVRLHRRLRASNH